MKWKRKDMGSMNNEIKSYAKYYLRRNRKLILLIFSILFVLMPFLLYNQSNYGEDGLAAITLTLITFAFAGGCLAFLMPLLNYRFMYGKRSSDLYFSLPIKKGKLFDIQYVLGLVVIFVPLLINLILSMSLIYQKEPNVFFLPMLESIIGIVFFLIAQYTLFVFFAHKCNNMLDAVFINTSYLVLPAILIGSCAAFFSNQVGNIMVSNAGWSEDFFTILNPDFISFISLPYTAIVYAFKVFTEAYNKLQTNASIIDLFSWWMLVYWIIVMGATYFFGRKSFIQRREEYAENRSTSLLTYPCVSTAITFLLLLLVINVMDSLLILPLIIIFLIYMAMMFFANRRIKIKIKYFIIFGVMFVSVYGCSIIFNTTQGFGIIQEVPNQSEIASVGVDYSFPKSKSFKVGNEDAKNYSGIYMNVAEESDIENILDMQKVFIEKGKLEWREPLIGMRLTFALKDGTSISRSYYSQTSLTEEMIEDQINSVIGDEKKVNELLRNGNLSTWLDQEY